MVAKLMELSNTLYRYRGTEVAGDTEWDEAIRLLLTMLAPAAPHITDELWSRRAAAAGREWTSIHGETWPTVDESAISVSVREVPVQLNGKLRARVVVRADASPADIEAAVLADEKVIELLAGRTPDRVIVAAGGKLVNIVVRD
jgi:leucyl-tRNA synthetase